MTSSLEVPTALSLFERTASKNDIALMNSAGDVLSYSRTSVRQAHAKEMQSAQSLRDTDLEISRSIISQLDASLTVDALLTSCKIPSEYKFKMFDQFLPAWLMRPINLEHKLFPKVSAFDGEVETPDDLRVYFGATTDTHVTLLSLLTALHRDKQERYKQGLSPMEYRQAMLFPELTNKEFIIMGSMVLLMTAGSEDSPSAQDAIVIIPRLMFMDMDTMRHQLFESYPRVSKLPKPSKAEHREIVNRLIEYTGLVHAFGRATVTAIADPDDPRHEIARSWIEICNDLSNQTMNELIGAQITMLEQNNALKSVSYIETLYKATEDTDDEWYKGLANSIIDLVRRELPYRVFFTDEVKHAFWQIGSTVYPEDANTEGRLERIHALDSELMQAGVGKNEYAHYVHELDDAILEKNGVDPSRFSLSVHRLSKIDERVKSNWDLIIEEFIENADVVRRSDCVVIEDEDGMFVWTDTVDQNEPEDPLFEEHIYGLLELVLSDGVNKLREEQHTRETFQPKAESKAVIIGSSPSKGSGGQRRRDFSSKPDDEEGDFAFHNETSMTRNTIHQLMIDKSMIRNHDHAKQLQLAIDRYRMGSRRMKILESFRRQGETVYELRAGTYRLLFSQNGGSTLTLLDIIHRRDLDSWIRKRLGA